MRVLFAILLSFAATVAAAQQPRVQLRTSRGPHYVGEPVIVQLTVEGLEEGKAPKSEMVSSTSGLRAQLVDVSPSISQSMQIIGNRVTRQRSVLYRIRYHVTTDKPGEYEVGPFNVTQGQTKLQTRAVSLRFETVAIDPDMRVKLLLPQRPVYPGERATVTVEWWYAKAGVNSASNLRIHTPLFDRFKFLDIEPTREAQLLPVQTAAGEVQLVADVREQTEDGKPFVVLTAKRRLIADQVGTHEIGKINASIRKVTRWERESFGFGLLEGRRRAAEAVPMRAEGPPQKLVVKPLPTVGRPDSFAGAVGAGFTLEVSANRTVVRVGDPITLQVTLHGKAGNLEDAGLPSLSADGGLDPTAFRLPDGDMSGEFNGDTKKFNVNVRVLSDSVSEIPALAYSWFDPEAEEFRTARSKPIALRVDPAQVVSASDVVSGAARRTKKQQTEDVPSPSAELAARTGALSLSGADLALETDAGAVLRSPGSLWTSHWLLGAAYGAGMLLMMLAWVERRRRNVDPETLSRRRGVRDHQHAIAEAKRLPPREAAEVVAGAVRGLVALAPDVRRSEAQQVVAECESVIFAPAGPNQGSLDEGLLDRASRVADAFAEEVA